MGWRTLPSFTSDGRKSRCRFFLMTFTLYALYLALWVIRCEFQDYVQWPFKYNLRFHVLAFPTYPFHPVHRHRIHFCDTVTVITILPHTLNFFFYMLVFLFQLCESDENNFTQSSTRAPGRTGSHKAILDCVLQMVFHNNKLFDQSNAFTKRVTHRSLLSRPYSTGVTT